MRILVTGGGGFLGSALVTSLAKSRKNDILVFDSYTHGFPKKFLKRLRSPIVGKIQNYYDIYRATEHFAPEVVVHLAAFNTRPEVIGQVRACAEVNYLGTANLLEACLMVKEKPKKLIFASSEAARDPVFNFGISKRAAEDLIDSTLLSFPDGGIVPMTLRFSEIYGYGRPYSSNCLVNFLVDNMLGGNDIALYGVTKKRDYIHISDAVRACELAIGYDAALPKLDIGSGKGIITKDLVAEVRRLTKHTGELRFLESRVVQVQDSVVDPAPAESLLGFACEADFDTELKVLIAKRKKDLR